MSYLSQQNTFYFHHLFAGLHILFFFIGDNIFIVSMQHIFTTHPLEEWHLNDSTSRPPNVVGVGKFSHSTNSQ